MCINPRLPKVDKASTVRLRYHVLARNDSIAHGTRDYFTQRGILALNLVSAPGAGKTTLLEHTIRVLQRDVPIYVIEGDQETSFDADRIRATGCPAQQINTGAGCHLEAKMVADAVAALSPVPGSLVMIENVGNLVCPALFDLGEHAKVVISSVTEGDDKPLKYPYMFRNADLMLLNKIDLLPYVQFDVSRCWDYAKRVNPQIETMPICAAQAQELGPWYTWLRRRLAAHKRA